MQTVTMQPIPDRANIQQQPRLHKRNTKIVGWIQLFLGVASIIGGIVAIVIQSRFSNGGIPIWSGACYIIAGCFCTSAGYASNKCKLNAGLSMCIVSIVVAVNQFAWMLGGAITENEMNYDCAEKYDYDVRYGYYDYQYQQECYGQITVDSLLTVVALTEILVAIYGTVLLSPVATCCCPSTSPATMIVYQTVPIVPQQNFILQRPSAYQPVLTSSINQPGHQMPIQGQVGLPLAVQPLAVQPQYSQGETQRQSQLQAQQPYASQASCVNTNLPQGHQQSQQTKEQDPPPYSI